MSRSQRRAPAEDKSALELAESSEWAALERLVAADAGRADERDDFGMAPLHWACTDTHVPLRVVRRLAAARPDALAQPNKAGLVPLHIAVKAAAKLEVLQHLAHAHEDGVLRETPAGETAAELARNVGLSGDKVAFLASLEQQLRADGHAPTARSVARLLASQPYMEEFALSGSNRSARKVLASPSDDDWDALSDGDQENRPTQANTAKDGGIGGGKSLQTPSLLRASSSVSTSSALASAAAASPATKASMSAVHTLRFPPHSLMMNSREHVPPPPRWRLDKRCNICQLKFSYFRARHHCRNCGESVCSTHSNARAPLPHLGLAAPQRVCILCFDELRATSNAPNGAMAVVNLLPGRKFSMSALMDKVGGSGHHGLDDDDDEDDVGSMTLPAGRPPLRATQSSTYSSSSKHPTRPFRSPSAASAASDRPSRLVFPSEMPSDYHGPTLALPMAPDADDELAVRPRAWTDFDVAETLAERHEQLRELEAHSKELESAKRALRESLARTTSQIHAAVRERMVHERTVAELRDNRIIDINRISLGDDDEPVDRQAEREAEPRGSNSDDKPKLDGKGNPRRSLVSDETVTLVEDTDVDVAMTSKFLGQAFLAKREYGSAVAELQRSVEANRRDPDVWYNLAQALLGNEQLFEAERAAERALSLSARSYAAMSLLGKILHAKGEHERAIGVFQDALSLMENDDDSDEDVGSMTVGW